MSDRHEFESLLSASLQTRPPSSRLAERVSQRVLKRLAGEPPPCRRPLRAIAAGLLTLVLAVWLVRDRELTPALQLSRMAVAADAVPLAHLRSYEHDAQPSPRLVSELWVQPPFQRGVRQQGSSREVFGFDGERAWRYSTASKELVITANARHRTPDGFTVQALLRQFEAQDRQGDGELSTGPAPSGRSSRILTWRATNGERYVCYADPVTHLPFRVDISVQPRNEHGRPDSAAPFRLVTTHEIDYPAPLPREFYQPDAPAGYRRTVETVPVPPTAEELRASLSGPALAAFAGPDGLAVPIVDVAVQGDLVYVAYTIDPREENVQLSFLNLNGYLGVAAGAPSARRHDGVKGTFPGGVLVGGHLFCTPDAGDQTLRPTLLHGLVTRGPGRDFRESQVELPASRLRAVTSPPAWWLALVGSQGGTHTPDLARANHWLGKDSHKAVHYAEAVVAPASNRWLASQPSSWQLLGDARRRAGDLDGAAAAYQQGLDHALAMPPEVREPWQQKLNAALLALEDRSGDAPSGGRRGPALP